MRLSRREKLLAGLMAGAIFIVFNLVLFKSFASKQAALRQQLATRRNELKSMQVLLSEREVWTQRTAWLAEKQPKLANENSAGVQLLENIRDAAKKHSITLDHQTIASPARTQWYRSVAVTLETKSSWEALVEFLRGLQQPEQFLVFESANIAIDGTDASQMRGKFRIARWYRPD